ncbi:unnamed protein product [Nyctereutes procyonoides]|uniref:(raccoon dog) hypothetical protein n=1 Tax=Nyctereutes procyonoides TaxID=34880 RepID=A0A811YWS8_NYCPR|nr:unnamed protein product [Nyctereutes procyonoides]
MLRSLEKRSMTSSSTQNPTSTASFQVWNKYSSSKNLTSRLQKIWRNYLNVKDYKVSYKGLGPDGQVQCRGPALPPLGPCEHIHSRGHRFSLQHFRMGFLPKENIRTKTGPWGRFAIISSAGSLKSSQFNEAPTTSSSQNVGTKTTIRHFLKDSLYSEGFLIWKQSPDYSFFENCKSCCKLHPDQPFYILKPEIIIIIMMLCDQMDTYKFLPSKKFFGRTCTMSAYHPLLFEKNLVKHLNQGTDKDIYLLGKTILPAFQGIPC